MHLAFHCVVYVDTRSVKLGQQIGEGFIAYGIPLIHPILIPFPLRFVVDSFQTTWTRLSRCRCN